MVGGVSSADRSGGNLAIPFAMCLALNRAVRADEPRRARPLSPLKARREQQSGIRLQASCPVCKQRLDKRLDGIVRQPYFAHKKMGSGGFRCPLRADTHFTVRTRSRDSVRQQLKSRTRELKFALELRSRRGRMEVFARGDPLSFRDYTELKASAGTTIDSQGVKHDLSLDQLAGGYSELIVPVGDPLVVAVQARNRGARIQCTWRRDITPLESQHRCILFVEESGGRIVQSADLGDEAEFAWILFQRRPQGSLEQQVTNIQESLSIPRVSPDAVVRVSGMQKWAAARLPWAEGGLALAAALRVGISTSRTPLRIEMLDADAIRAGSTTTVASPSGKCSLALEPQIFDDVSVLVLPFPYSDATVGDQLVSFPGGKLEIQLEPGEADGEVFILVSEPERPDIILQEHRVNIVTSEADGNHALANMQPPSEPFGIWFEDGGAERVVIPASHRRSVIAQFPGDRTDPSVKKLSQLRFVVPSVGNGSAAWRNVQLVSHGSVEADSDPIGASRVEDSDQANQLLLALARNDDCASITVDCGLLGYVHIRRAAALAASSRIPTRLRVVLAVWNAYEGKRRLPAKVRKEIIASCVPVNQQAHGWEAEINAVTKRIHAHESTTEQARLDVCAYIASRDAEEFSHLDWDSVAAIPGIDPFRPALELLTAGVSK